MSDTVKKKAVHVVRIADTDANGKTKMVNGKPSFTDHQPNTTFDCPKHLVAELAKSGSIAAPGRVTAMDVASKQVIEDAEIINDDDDEDDDASTEDDAIAVADMTKPQLVAHAKDLKLKPAKGWNVDKLREEIAKAEAASSEDDEDVL